MLPRFTDPRDDAAGPSCTGSAARLRWSTAETVVRPIGDRKPCIRYPIRYATFRTSSTGPARTGPEVPRGRPGAHPGPAPFGVDTGHPRSPHDEPGRAGPAAGD